MCYKTYNAELLAIVKAFNNLCHYLEDCQYEILVLINHNNLRQFMNAKNFSSRQIYWGQELSRYHFHINYCQGKANKAVDALSRYSQWSRSKKEILQAKNRRIF